MAGQHVEYATWRVCCCARTLEVGLTVSCLSNGVGAGRGLAAGWPYGGVRITVPVAPLVVQVRIAGDGVEVPAGRRDKCTDWHVSLAHFGLGLADLRRPSSLLTRPAPRGRSQRIWRSLRLHISKWMPDSWRPSSAC